VNESAPVLPSLDLAFDDLAALPITSSVAQLTPTPIRRITAPILEPRAWDIELEATAGGRTTGW
ncbi:unnamed protein product, partial [Rhizoctonia solani]